MTRVIDSCPGPLVAGRSTDAAAGAAAHDPAHRHVDHPQHHAGVHSAHHGPFEDIERFIAHLDQEDREAWQKPDAVVASLELAGGETVADLGAGSGYFTVRFAAALPRGKVVALDVRPEMVEHLRQRAMTEGRSNVVAALAVEDDPKVPAGVDVVFVCNVFHHVDDRTAWLGKVASALAPGARLVLVEFRMGELPVGPPDEMRIPAPELVHLAKSAGFELVREDTELLPYQTLMVFRRR